MRRLIGFTAGLAVLALAPAASAGHMAYLAPLTFAPHRDMVTVQAAMSEEAHMFVPDFPIRGAGDFMVTGPDGVAAKITSVTVLKEMAIVEAPLASEGTYRISSGERDGRSAKWARIDGVWRMVRGAGGPPRPSPPPGEAPRAEGPIDEAAVPAGAETLQSISTQRADLYVTRGAPKAFPKPVGQSLEIAPLSHPNDLYAGDAFRFQVLVDGQPAVGATLSIVRANDAYAAQHFTWSGTTKGGAGEAVTFDQPGVYVIQAQYPPRVEGAAPVAKSMTATLTFEVSR
ncbi:DUF4198 domain-containing protein [Phenylobacterium aquaticum]|uniref:DUF4198 domain-containing protein n=1 Tax=Phenylobacterium aquaticum TaxID=1763816 RepID=UPI0026ECB3A2|nr:DUF4198 domain-containing protein [Phenylobacterium aquaticum]